MSKSVIHVSELEATADFASLLARVRAGAEVVIEQDATPVAILHPARPVRRTIVASLALMSEDSTATLDAEFARDVDAAIGSHPEPLAPPTWD